MGIIKRFDHLAIGVENIEEARAFFCDVLGAEALPDKGESSAEEFAWQSFTLGDGKVELVAPFEKGQGGVGRYIEKNGEGFHHISISVGNIEEAREHFTSKGIRILGGSVDDEVWRHFYLHPKDTFGALIQVFEENE